MDRSTLDVFPCETYDIRIFITKTKLKSSISYKEIFPWSYHLMKPISVDVLTSKYLPDLIAYYYWS